MSTMEPEEEQNGLSFRTLFPEDEIHAFFQPVFQLPTRQIAYGSIGLSVLLAAALVMSSMHDPNRGDTHQKPGPFFRKKTLIHPSERQNTDTAMYLRRQTR